MPQSTDGPQRCVGRNDTGLSHIQLEDMGGGAGQEQAVQ
jgi:hypothetical protein